MMRSWSGTQRVQRSADEPPPGDGPGHYRYCPTWISPALASPPWITVGRQSLAEDHLNGVRPKSIAKTVCSFTYRYRAQHVLMALEKACEHIHDELSVGARHRRRNRCGPTIRQDDAILRKEACELLH